MKNGKSVIYQMRLIKHEMKSETLQFHETLIVQIHTEIQHQDNHEKFMPTTRKYTANKVCQNLPMTPPKPRTTRYRYTISAL